MEATTGNVLFAHEADTQLYPASTTKIMTLLLALERGGLDQEITIPACAADVPKDSSLVPVYEGEQMRFSTCSMASSSVPATTRPTPWLSCAPAAWTPLWPA